MEIDVGFDATGLSDSDEIELVVDAARCGYTRIWTSSGGDPFQLCALRSEATRRIVPGGIGTATGVVTIAGKAPAGLVEQGAALSRQSGGRFILGIGIGSAYQASYRATWGITESSPLKLMRSYLATMRHLLSGEPGSTGENGTDGSPHLLNTPRTLPLYLGALGPEMLRLGGELADGVYLSWSTRQSIALARTRIAEGAARIGRDPNEVRLAASVRVSVDEDAGVARRALAAALLPYVIGWDGTPPIVYRNEFVRMGFEEEVGRLEEHSRRETAREELLDAFPERMLERLGYFGPAAGAASFIERQTEEADIIVVRPVPSGPQAGSFSAILAACAPITN